MAIISGKFLLYRSGPTNKSAKLLVMNNKFWWEQATVRQLKLKMVTVSL